MGMHLGSRIHFPSLYHPIADRDSIRPWRNVHGVVQEKHHHQSEECIMRYLSRSLLIAAGLLVSGPALWAQEDARAILDKAIQARGGEANLAKMKALRLKVKGTLELPQLGQTEFSGESFYELPNRYRSNMELQVQGMQVPVIAIFDGASGWRSIMGMGMDIAGQDLTAMKNSVYAQYISTLLPLRDKQFELTKLPEIQVNGKPAVGLKVVAKDRPEVKFYFDKETGLMVKGERMTPDRQTGMDVLSESLISEWKDVKGIKFAMKSQVLRGGKKVEEVQTVEVEYLDKLDAKLFSKP
jgi:hypothetical protein